MITIKKILIFITILLLWFIETIFKLNIEYNNINLPFFTPPILLYEICFIITYILISISITQIISNYRFEDLKKYIKLLIINYISNKLFIITFFIYNNLFIGFISSLSTFITVLYLYEETTNLNEKSTKYLNTYVLLSLFSTVLTLTIYLIN